MQKLRPRAKTDFSFLVTMRLEKLNTTLFGLLLHLAGPEWPSEKSFFSWIFWIFVFYFPVELERTLLKWMESNVDSICLIVARCFVASRNSLLFSLILYWISFCRILRWKSLKILLLYSLFIDNLKLRNFGVWLECWHLYRKSRSKLILIHLKESFSSNRTFLWTSIPYLSFTLLKIALSLTRFIFKNKKNHKGNYIKHYKKVYLTSIFRTLDKVYRQDCYN